METNEANEIKKVNKQNKIAVVLGGSSGIGREIALTLKEEGLTVVASGRNLNSLRELTKLGIIALELDVNDRISIEKFLVNIQTYMQKIDVLINCVGYADFIPFEVTTNSSGKAMFETNFFAIADLINKMIPMLEKRTIEELMLPDSKIINVTSIVSRVSLPLLSWYSASKAALESMSDSLRFELKKSKIKVITIQPGAVKTSFYRTDQDLQVLHNEKYENQFNKAHLTYREIYDKYAIDPKVVADVVKNVVAKKNPRCKYLVGRDAYLLATIQRIFGQRVLTFIVNKRFRNFDQ